MSVIVDYEVIIKKFARWLGIEEKKVDEYLTQDICGYREWVNDEEMPTLQKTYAI